MAKTAKNTTVNVHVEGKSGKELAKKVVKAIAKATAEQVKKTAEPAKTETLPAKKENIGLEQWFDKNLGTIDCEQCAWSMTQTMTSMSDENASSVFKHVFSDGDHMFCATTTAGLKLAAPVMPAGVYDPVLAGKGKAKRRTFIPVNAENSVDRIKNIFDKAENDKVIAKDVFDFSISAPLNSETFALQYFAAVAGKNCVISDPVMDLVTSSCQKLTCKIGENYICFENEVMKLIFVTTRMTNPETQSSHRVLSTIQKYSRAALPAPVEKTAEKPVEPKKPELKLVKKPENKPVEKKVKKPAKTAKK